MNVCLNRILASSSIALALTLSAGCAGTTPKAQFSREIVPESRIASLDTVQVNVNAANDVAILPAEMDRLAQQIKRLVDAKTANPRVGESKAYELDLQLSRGFSVFQHIGSDTIQQINAEYATRRNSSRKIKLRWRKSFGSKRSLGWVPFKAVQLKRQGKCLRFSGKAFRVFERELLGGLL